MREDGKAGECRVGSGENDFECGKRSVGCKPRVKNGNQLSCTVVSSTYDNNP